MSLQCDFVAFSDLCGMEAKVSLRSGEFLFREGDEADALYIVSRGTLRIASGSTVYEVIHAGDIVGEMAMVDRGTAELVKVDASDFLTLTSAAPDFALMVMRVMARRLRLMNQRYRPQATTW